MERTTTMMIYILLALVGIGLMVTFTMRMLNTAEQSCLVDKDCRDVIEYDCMTNACSRGICIQQYSREGTFCKIDAAVGACDAKGVCIIP